MAHATIQAVHEIAAQPVAGLVADHTGRICVAIVGATGYVGGELIRLLDRHPHVRIVGVTGRGRADEPIGSVHPHLGRTGYRLDAGLPETDAVFLALPHGAAAEIVPGLAAKGTRVIDLGPDFRLHDPADYPRWYGFEHPAPELLRDAVYGLPELHRDALEALRDHEMAIVGAPGCYPTTTLLALAPLAREGLIGDLVVDAKTGVSGAGREPKPDFMFTEVNESVRAYGLDGHRHTAEIEQELAAASGTEPGEATARRNPGAVGVDFVPHLIPMTRGIFSTSHVRPSRPISSAELRELYRDAYATEPFVEVSDSPVTTGQVLGSNFARVHVTMDERSGRIRAIGVTDNLVKGAAGQAVQCFNILFGLPETAGLEQLPLYP
jgi:N-acetyl-gamma-glutamyl-phosphate reductase